MGVADENEQKLQQLHPLLAARVRALLADLQAKGYVFLITQGLRTWAEQDALYAKGRTAPGNIVTKAAGGHSHHNFGLAVDLCPEDNGALDWNTQHPAWKAVLALAPQHKLAEGAQWRTFPDTPHFYPVEIPATTEILRAKYAEGGMDEVNQWVNTLTTPA